MVRIPASWLGGVFLCAILAFPELARATGEPASSSPETLGDATLHDVFFLDPDRGWAVGDRGVVWETSDGGRHWRLTDSPTTACLRSISFVDENHGWIAGGWIHPYSRRTSGVLLRTDNGGRTWTKVEIPNIPALRQISFTSTHQGAALGDSSAMYSTGYFQTRDGGFTWEPRSAKSPGPLEKSPWRLNDGGTVYRLDERGEPREVLLQPVQNVAREFNWQAIHSRGEQCWVAGSPGTTVLRSDDGGRTWKRFGTGQTTPLRKLFFFDEQHGWAVGDLGRILATRDGGQTWRIQHTGGERAGLLVVTRNVEAVPLTVLAKAAADEGVLAVVQSWLPSPPPPNHELPAAQQLSEATSLVGASAAQVHSRPASPAEWNRKLVQALRIWRPEVVITEPLSERESDQAWSRELLQAVQDAANPARHGEQLALAGLQPWTVRKVMVSTASNQPASLTFDTRRTSVTLGCSLDEYCLAARGVVAGDHASLADITGCRLLWSQAQVEVAGKEIMSGIPGVAANEYRRPTANPLATDVETMSRTANLLRNIQEIAIRTSGVGEQAGEWLPQLEQLLQSQSPIAAGRILFRLAGELQAAGQYLAAAQCYQFLWNKYPDHPLSDAAALWLVRFYGSTELSHSFGTPSLTRLPATASGTGRALQPAAAVLPWQAVARAVPIPSTTPTVIAERDAPADPGWQVMESIQQTRPALYADPRIQFAILAHARRLGKTAEVKKTLNILGSSALPPTWRLIARQEQLLQERTPVAARPTATSSLTYQKPHLDGDLVEPCWNAASPIVVPGQSPVRLWFCHDREFLFVAAQGLAGTEEVPPSPSVQARRRDADLSGRPHVRLQLDVDRDYHVAYELAFDRTGLAAERSGGDRRWNPTWFVASANHTTEEGPTWCVETAIAWESLVRQCPEDGDYWGLKAALMPAAAMNDMPPTAWPDSAVAGVGEVGFGLLRFAGDDARGPAPRPTGERESIPADAPRGSVEPQR